MNDILTMNKGQKIKVRLTNNEEFPNSPVKSIKFNVENEWGNVYCKACFENGKEIEFEFISYEDSIPYRDNINLEKYRAATAATNKVKAAIEEYHKDMAAIGAINHEYCDHDYQEEWLEIPEVPDYKWQYY